MRIILFTVNDIDYVPILNEKFIDRFKDEIAQVYISTSLFEVKKLLKKYQFFIKNKYPFCIKINDLISYFKWKVLPIKKKGKVIDYCKNKGLKASYVNDINASSFLEKLKAIQPDIILFNPFDKIAGTEFLSIPSIGTYNVHLGKLPEYRGGLVHFGY